MGLQNPLEPLPLFIRGNLARDADVFHRRHVNHKPSGQSDVRCDARALLSKWFLRDLDDDLLAFLQQV